MSARCEICGKTKSYGNNVSFSKRHTSRTFQPNTHKKHIVLNGTLVRVNICTRCMRTAAKTAKV